MKLIRGRGKYERNILRAKIEELKLEKRLENSKNPLEIARLKAKHSTYNMWRYVLERSEVDYRNRINSKVHEWKILAESASKSPLREIFKIDATSSHPPYGVKEYEMPSFSLLTKELFEEQLGLGKDSSVEEFKAQAKALKNVVEGLSKQRDIEQGLRAKLIYDALDAGKKLDPGNIGADSQNASRSGTPSPDSQERTTDNVVEGINNAVYDKLKNALNKMGKNDLYSSLANFDEHRALGSLMAKLAENQKNKPNKLKVLELQDLEWAGFVRPFKYAYRPETGASKNLKEIGQELMHWGIPESMVKSPQRTAATLALLSPFVGAVGAGLVGTVPLWGPPVLVSRHKKAIVRGIKDLSAKAAAGIKDGTVKTTKGINYLSNRVLDKYDDYKDWRSPKESKQREIKKLQLLMMKEIEVNMNLRPLEQKKKRDKQKAS